ncbi:MAG TPA: hypothetical protein VHL11_00570 [Phototrophicaceae bacterium]|nr:hypothetical protein [Phototrophicaceae bacterium]
MLVLSACLITIAIVLDDPVRLIWLGLSDFITPYVIYRPALSGTRRYFFFLPPPPPLPYPI